MDKPAITAKEPAMVTLEPGRHAWCACGLTQKGAFCDGAHKGTTFRPVIMQVTDQPEPVALCLCKQTKTPPYCDGSHSSL